MTVRRDRLGLTRSDPGLATHTERHGPLPDLARVAPPRLRQEITDAGLLGRGGAGFPAGVKLTSVAGHRGRAVVVANGMEGEPAAGKDLALLLRAPHLVLDGIAVAVRATGADQAYLAVHSGSPARGALRRALSERRDTVVPTVVELPARYVASEESALVRGVGGGKPVPPFTPPRPFESGVNGRPTAVLNVETLAHLAQIVRHGAAWFRSEGTATDPGTRIATVSAQGGRAVLEVAAGAPVGDVLSEAGVRLSDVRAVVTGGWFGTWVAGDVAARLPFSLDGMATGGAAVGAGVLAVVPVGACGLIELSRVTTWMAGQSARQCGPCLNGLPAMAVALQRLAAGSARQRDITDVQRWAGVVTGRGACHHPDGTARFVTTGLRVLSDEVARHLRHEVCRPGPPVLPLPSHAEDLLAPSGSADRRRR